MHEIQPLRPSTHANLRWLASTGYKFTASSLMLPIAMNELAAASVSLPLAFANPGNPNLVALTGLRPNQNLFVSAEGGWLGDYLPATLRGYPFKLLPTNSGKWALGFDHASGLLSETEGEPFFTPDGKPTDKLQHTLNFLVRLNAGLRHSTEAAATLARHKLLEPWPLKVRDNDRDIPIEGLLRVSEEKLAQLDDQSFLALRANGVLALAYAQLLSMANIDTLGKLARRHAQEAAHATQHQEAVKSMFVPPEPEDQIDWDAMLRDDDKS